MLDKAIQDALGREMRRIFDQRPKGEIPERIWRLLVSDMPAAPARPDDRRPGLRPLRD